MPAPSAAASRPSGRASARSCGAWNTLVESARRHRARTASRASPARARAMHQAGRRRGPCERQRIPTGIEEFDRVLGGGLVAGGGGADRRRSRASASRRCCCRRCAALGARAPHAVRHRRGIGRADRAARPAARRWSTRRSSCLPKSSSKRSSQRSPQPQPDIVVIDSIQTIYTEALASAPGSGRAGARMRGAADAHRQAARHRRAVRRPRHQGRRARRTARARAHRRHRAVFRGRHPLELPPGARDQEPLRRRERARRVRDDRERPRKVWPILRRCSCRSTPSGVAGSCVLATQEGTRPLLVEMQALVDRCRA